MSNRTEAAANSPARRDLLTGIALAAVTATAASLPASEAAAQARPAAKAQGRRAKPIVDGDYIVTREGVRLYFKDWGPKDGPVVTLSHGWPLSSDSL